MKLYRFAFSPYAHKVQVLLDLLGLPYTPVDVGYCDRAELVALTGGSIHIPVLVDDDAKVVTDSRRIAAHLLRRPGGAALVPSPWEGPIWAYSDWVDGPLEEVLFRLVGPRVRDTWARPDERAFYTLIKERKFGTGCIDAWIRDRESLLAQARELLTPSAKTLAAQPFLFGARPTLADAALFGQFGMLAADPTLPPASFGETFPAWISRLDAARAASGPSPAAPLR